MKNWGYHDAVFNEMKIISSCVRVCQITSIAPFNYLPKITKLCNCGRKRSLVELLQTQRFKKKIFLKGAKMVFHNRL